MESKTNNISNRRGKIIVKDCFLGNNLEERLLKVLFENFYPIAIEPLHDYGHYNDLKYYGYSPHFREIIAGEMAPQYEIVLRRLPDETIELVEMKEVKI